jgi:hypothetical protein
MFPGETAAQRVDFSKNLFAAVAQPSQQKQNSSLSLIVLL